VFDPDLGVRAVAWAVDNLWVLGLDNAGQAVIQGYDADGDAGRLIVLGDDSACGIAAAPDSTLWVAYPDRRFESIALFESSP
jgi:hypothetical protein